MASRVLLVALGLILAAETRGSSSPAPFYADHSTHKLLTEHAIKLAGRSGDYGEFKYFAETIAAAAVAEDESPRMLNHFFDPSTGAGMPRNFYAIFFAGEKPRIRETEFSFMSAFDWAKNGMPDHNDWESALGFYDYTGPSRRRAYEALGHVIHLLQDMAQPDHARCRPHPGGYANEKIAKFSKAGADYLFPPDRVGYEKLWDLNDGKWPEAKMPRKPRDLPDAFRTMANESKAAEDRRQLPNAARGELALGLRSYRSASAFKGGRGREAVGEVATVVYDALAGLWRASNYEALEDNHWTTFELGIPIVPTIPWPATAETTPYLELGNELLPLAEERSAGLMQYFHDIVNPPPYVESVSIEQDGEAKYFKRWRDATKGDKVTGRTLVGDAAKPIKRKVGTKVRIAFGPYLLVEGKEYRKHPRHVRVWLEPARAEQGKEPPPEAIEIKGNFVRAAGGSTVDIWEGHFTVQAAGRLRIRAEDQDHHLERRDPSGELLDSNPADPARIKVEAGYPWEGYQPGDDLNHSFKLDEGCDLCRWTHPQVNSMRAGVWTGTLTSREESLRDGKWDLFCETKIEVSFRSLAKRSPWSQGVPFVVLHFGRSDGKFECRWKRGADDPIKTASGPVGLTGDLFLLPPAGKDEHGYQLAFRIEEGKDHKPGDMPSSGTIVKGKATVGDRLQGKEESSGAFRRKIEWDFSLKPAETPKHAVLYLKIGEDESQDLDRYSNLLWKVIEPVIMARGVADGPELKIMEETQKAMYAHHGKAQRELKPRIKKLYEEAEELWLSPKPGGEDDKYEAKFKELDGAVQDWVKIRREIEKGYAAETERGAAALEKDHPVVAERFRAYAARLLKDGSENFGAGSR